jgi:hypothetical protein
LGEQKLLQVEAYHQIVQRDLPLLKVVKKFDLPRTSNFTKNLQDQCLANQAHPNNDQPLRKYHECLAIKEQRFFLNDELLLLQCIGILEILQRDHQELLF